MRLLIKATLILVLMNSMTSAFANGSDDSVVVKTMIMSAPKNEAINLEFCIAGSDPVTALVAKSYSLSLDGETLTTEEDQNEGCKRFAFNSVTDLHKKSLLLVVTGFNGIFVKVSLRVLLATDSSRLKKYQGPVSKVNQIGFQLKDKGIMGTGIADITLYSFTE